MGLDRSAGLLEDLSALAERVGPLALAGERTLPVPEAFAELFPERGLVRGRTFACSGPAATSLALALAAPAVAAGSWLATIDVPTIGLDAARELGIALERVVAVRTSDRTDTIDRTTDTIDRLDRTVRTTDPTVRAAGRRDRCAEGVARWPDVVAAAADGFDLLITTIPADVSPAAMRRVATRLRRREVVMLILGSPGAWPCDGVLDAGAVEWVGLGDGHGHLRQRRLVVEASGRRLHGRRRCRLALPG